MGERSLCFVAGTGYTAYQPTSLSNPLKTSHPLPTTPTLSANQQTALSFQQGAPTLLANHPFAFSFYHIFFADFLDGYLIPGYIF